jgi:hypothetical protein
MHFQAGRMAYAMAEMVSQAQVPSVFFCFLPMRRKERTFRENLLLV